MNPITIFSNAVRTARVRQPQVRPAKVRTSQENPDSVAWGKINLSKIDLEKISLEKIGLEKTGGAVVFAALLLICSIAVGCSSDKPKTESALTPSTQPLPPVVANAPATPNTAGQIPPKPVRKATHKAPATVTYADKTSGVSFEYPRKYTLKTGEEADELVSSDPVPMNFAQPGGVALALVELPNSAFPETDLAWAFFNVSLNKAVTEEQCGQFSQMKTATPTDVSSTAPTPQVINGKLMIGELELQSTETLVSQGTNQEAAKYYHVFENGGCYEFALKVATNGVETKDSKHVDQKEVFGRLEKILATVKITPMQDVASVPATPSGGASPAQ
jgi:hypothetical protein